MGFYREPVAPTRARARNNGGGVRVRVASDSLGASWATNVLNKYGYTSTFQPIAPTPTPTPPAITGSFALPLISPTPTAPAPITIRTFSPVAPTPTPTPVSYSPPPPSSSSPPPPPASPSSPPSTPATQSSGDTSGGGSAPGPDTSAPDTPQGGPTQIRFSADATPVTGAAMLPDASGPEVYNADGTPATPAATAATTPTIADTIKNLPTAAKIGGVVALYILFGRR